MIWVGSFITPSPKEHLWCLKLDFRFGRDTRLAIVPLAPPWKLSIENRDFRRRSYYFPPVTIGRKFDVSRNRFWNQSGLFCCVMVIKRNKKDEYILILHRIYWIICNIYIYKYHKLNFCHGKYVVSTGKYSFNENFTVLCDIQCSILRFPPDTFWRVWYN